MTLTLDPESQGDVLYFLGRVPRIRAGTGTFDLRLCGYCFSCSCVQSYFRILPCATPLLHVHWAGSSQAPEALRVIVLALGGDL